jgi:2-dehydrotetronate isomerase
LKRNNEENLHVFRFSANLGFLWPELPLLDRIDAAAEAGFPAIEMHWPYDTPAENVRSRCEQRGLKLLGVNTSRGDHSKGEFGLGAVSGREDEFQAAVDQSVNFCVAANGSAIHCMAGKVEPNRKDAARSVFIENLRTASRKAAVHGITLLLEPINPRDAPGYFYSTVAEGGAIIDACGCENLKLMFDCYHVGVAEGDVLTKLERFLPVIGHIQIAAVPSRAEPDEGELNYREIFKAIDWLGYDGYVGCEYKPRGSTGEGLAWASRLGVAISR